MKFTKKKKKAASIPTSSMSDIAFLLIIFFMATTKFDMKLGLGLVLPPVAEEGAEKVKLNEKNITKIFINNTSQIMVNEVPMTMAQLPELEELVRKSVLENPKMVFSLKTDRDAKYNDMISVLDRLQRAGADKISLSTN